MNLREAIETIGKLRLLEKNWDGYGGNKLSDIAGEYSLYIVEQVASPDYIHPLSDGGVQLDYESKTNKSFLEIDVHFDGSVGYMFCPSGVYGENCEEKDEDIDGVITYEDLRLLIYKVKYEQGC